LITAPAHAQVVDAEFNAHLVATFKSGMWRADAAYFGSDYDSGPQYACRIATPGAMLFQIRPPESDQMVARWHFPESDEAPAGQLQVDGIRVGGKSYQVASLPWRLAGPPEMGGILLSFDIMSLVFRASSDDEWLPLAYLTKDMFGASGFAIDYRDQDNGEKAPRRRKRFNLEGFAAAARWCGRQLLSDRKDDPRVQALLR
jgi:hypothetical protein